MSKVTLQLNSVHGFAAELSSCFTLSYPLFYINLLPMEFCGRRESLRRTPVYCAVVHIVFRRLPPHYQILILCQDGGNELLAYERKEEVHCINIRIFVIVYGAVKYTFFLFMFLLENILLRNKLNCHLKSRLPKKLTQLHRPTYSEKHYSIMKSGKQFTVLQCCILCLPKYIYMYF